MTDMDIDEELTTTSLHNHNINGGSEIEVGAGVAAASDKSNLDPVLPLFDCYDEYVEVKQEEEDNALNRVSIATAPHPIPHPIQHSINLMQQPTCVDADPMNTHNQWREEAQKEDFDDDADKTRKVFIRSTSFISPTPMPTHNIHNPIRRASQCSNLPPTPPGEEEEEWTPYSEGINSTAREWDAQSDVNTVEHFHTDLPASVQWSRASQHEVATATTASIMEDVKHSKSASTPYSPSRIWVIFVAVILPILAAVGAFYFYNNNNIQIIE
ncbi:hypothetical protein HDU79_010861 [Rhizoclosmatium sp. JEL0117]|nr:hypothetical protein HDU79_010861 [Rhizoclosmatium sp. JEL0117]